MSRAFKDSHIIMGLLAALAVETLLLLWHAGVISWSARETATTEKPAGLIAKAENQLHRRGLNSLVWEKSIAQESVYFHDSLLTLAQSTATLNLDQGTEVTLSENTLVTLEPPDEKRDGQIRLKFSKGNLQARNPYRPARITGEDFSVDLKAGSELQLRQVGVKDFEIRIGKGEAQVVSADGAHRVSQDKLLRLSQGKARSVDLARDLKWRRPEAQRIYTHEPEVSVEVNWEGDGDELVVQTPSAPEWKIHLTPSMRGMKVPLTPGQHMVYVRARGRTSAPLDLEVRSAPVVHLLTPLPRNRVRTEESTVFLWQRWPEASGYVVKVDGAKHNISKELPLNTLEVVFYDEDDARWSVWVKDKDGHLMPPLYTYPLYIRHKPLAAPRLNTPQLRMPAAVKDKGAALESVFRKLSAVLLPLAHAEAVPTFEAIFSWYPVEGANLYWFEVSETPDFRHPLISAKTSKLEFNARGLKQQIYYWRVAAGHSSGRMGLFSEPAQVEVRAASVPAPPPLPIPAPVAMPQTPASVAAPQAPAPTPVAQAPATSENVKAEPFNIPLNGRFYWRGGYGFLKGKTPDTVFPELSGAKPLSFGAETDFFKREDGWISLAAKYGQVTFTPKPKSDYPFQPDITLQQIEVSLTRVSADSPWAYGVTAKTLPVFSRVSLEEFKVDPEFAFGPHLEGQWRLGSASSYGFNLGALISGEGWSVSHGHRLLTHPFDNALLLGVEAGVLYRSGNDASLLSVDGLLILGFEF